ncbi:MAG TPA: tRNA pseudouridine(55) synthase TruB [Streptosporangiaceae bacterium]|nr:tRNA pseudouridine(55) synthase TruB [Streptosporangiaceae bacterium]
MTAASGLLIVDKPAGWTSHDVVAKIRKLVQTKRVGHAGTLDPMATGVLVIGVEKATRLLGYLALTEKEYSATIRLGQTTDTDDADGELIDHVPVHKISEPELLGAMGALTGEIRQIPPGVSAIKVGGQRAYKVARAGGTPELAARTVTVREFTLLGIRQARDVVDIDVHVTCSSGTYIRALARDLGVGLEVGGHLTALRRTRVGPYLASQAQTLDKLAASAASADGIDVLPIAAAAAAAFPRRDLTDAEARAVGHGARLPATGTGETPVAAFAADGSLVALLTDQDGQARPLAVFAAELAY